MDQVYVMFDLYKFGAGSVGACIRLGKTESLCNCNIFKLYGFVLFFVFVFLFLSCTGNLVHGNGTDRSVRHYDFSPTESGKPFQTTWARLRTPGIREVSVEGPPLTSNTLAEHEARCMDHEFVLLRPQLCTG